MKILGIETSCDETAAAVVQNGKTVLSNVVVSSLKEHKPYGGIIPEIASRRQLECMPAIYEQALREAKCTPKDIHAIAVTQRPGLIGSLLVGLSFARALSFSFNKPLIYVDHIKAHAYANFLDLALKEFNGHKPTLPAVALVVSGGHTSLFHLKSFSQFRLLGSTLDDAAGEAFDKVAKILGLGYPGGPVINKVAQKGFQDSVRFRCAPLPETLNFSFSGVKTAVLYHHQRHHTDAAYNVNHVAHAFQDSVVTNLTGKCLAACAKIKSKTLLIGGGVAANTALRETLHREAGKKGIHVFFPPMSLCTDNAAMIAGLGYHLFKERGSGH